MRTRIIVSLVLFLSLTCMPSVHAITKGENMIKKGSKVSIHYVLKVEEEVVDSSEGREPLSYVQGSSQIIPGLEKELEGLKPGDKKSVDVPAENAYGKHDPEAIQTVPKKVFKEPDVLKVGHIVTGSAQGHEFQAVVVAIDKDNVTLDLNHPLAGKKLHFDVEIVSVE